MMHPGVWDPGVIWRKIWDPGPSSIDRVPTLLASVEHGRTARDYDSLKRVQLLHHDAAVHVSTPRPEPLQWWQVKVACEAPFEEAFYL